MVKYNVAHIHIEWMSFRLQNPIKENKCKMHAFKILYLLCIICQTEYIDPASATESIGTEHIPSAEWIWQDKQKKLNIANRSDSVCVYMQPKLVMLRCQNNRKLNQSNRRWKKKQEYIFKESEIKATEWIE